MPVSPVTTIQSAGLAPLQCKHLSGFFLGVSVISHLAHVIFFIHDYFWKYTEYKNIYRGRNHHHDILMFN
jgi:hypothetical protein